MLTRIDTYSSNGWIFFAPPANRSSTSITTQGHIGVIQQYEISHNISVEQETYFIEKHDNEHKTMESNGSIIYYTTQKLLGADEVLRDES